MATLTDARLSSSASNVVKGLEQLLIYYRTRTLDASELLEIEIRFALALARYRFAPPVAKMIGERAHVMIFGGAGTGKSTIANLLVGQEVAEVNAQAGYTRHPVALFRSDSAEPGIWPDDLGPLTHSDRSEPANVDRDLYATRTLESVADPAFFRRHVVWDCPDLTTKDASHYQNRLAEIAALAEIGVYVASDERYNDELPTNFLQAMLDAGKWIIVTLTKVAQHDADELISLFRRQVLARLRHADRVLGIIAVPSPGRQNLARLHAPDHPAGIALRDTIEQVTADFPQLRRTANLRATEYLRAQLPRLLAPVRQDLGEWQSWAELVRRQTNDAVLTYESEFLTRVEFEPLSAAGNELVRLTHWDGPLAPVTQILEWGRFPWRWLRDYGKRLQWSTNTPAGTEDAFLDRLRRNMAESLRVAIASRKTRHRVWAELYQSIDKEWEQAIEPTYQEVRDNHRRTMAREVEKSAVALRESVLGRPGLPGLLRVGRLVLDVSGICLALYATGATLGAVILVPIVLGLVDEAFTAGAATLTKQRRIPLVTQLRDQGRELFQNAYIRPLAALPRTLAPKLQELAGLVETLPHACNQLASPIGDSSK